MKTGVVYIKIRLDLNQDMDVRKVEDFVNGLDYEVKDEDGRIQNTELIEHDINVEIE